MSTTLKRCQWCGSDPLYCDYHDSEWGVPLHSSNGWYERIVLETMQAGLSWITVLRKRDHYRAVCHQFEPAIVAEYTEDDITRLMADPGVIRNRAKISAMIHNAQMFLLLQAKTTTIDDYFWRYVAGRPLQPYRQHPAQIPAITPIATQMAQDLRQRGFKFIGPTICYALMQATGLVNDHLVSCHRHLALR